MSGKGGGGRQGRQAGRRGVESYGTTPGLRSGQRRGQKRAAGAGPCCDGRMERPAGPAPLLTVTRYMHRFSSKAPPSLAPRAAAAPCPAPLLGHGGPCDNRQPEEGLDRGRGCRTGRCWAETVCSRRLRCSSPAVDPWKPLYQRSIAPGAGESTVQGPAWAPPAWQSLIRAQPAF